MKKIDKMLTVISLFGYLAFSVSFLLMPINSNPLSDEIEVVTIVSGIMFWSGLAVGILSQIILSGRRKKFVKIKGKKAFRNNRKKRFFGYFKNPVALVFYIFIIIGITGLAISMYMTRGTGLSCYIFISFFVFSVCYHFVFNGKNYMLLLNANKTKAGITNKKKNGKENDDAEDET